MFFHRAPTIEFVCQFQLAAGFTPYASREKPVRSAAPKKMKDTATDFMAVCACSRFRVGQDASPTKKPIRLPRRLVSRERSNGGSLDEGGWSKTLAISLLALALAAVWLPNTARPQGLEQPIHSFVYPGAAYPQAPLVQGSDGALYGTTFVGGYDNYGTVFKVSTNGAGCQVLYSFRGTTNGDGAGPVAGLV